MGGWICLNGCAAILDGEIWSRSAVCRDALLNRLNRPSARQELPELGRTVPLLVLHVQVFGNLRRGMFFFIRGFSGHQYFPIAGWLDPGINSFHHGSSGWYSPQYTWPNHPNHLFQSLVTLVPQAPTGSTWHRSWWCCDSVAGGSFGLCRSAAPGHSEWTHGGTPGLFSVEDGVMWLRSWRFLHLSKTRVLFTFHFISFYLEIRTERLGWHNHRLAGHESEISHRPTSSQLNPPKKFRWKKAGWWLKSINIY